MSESGFKIHAMELGPMENFVYLVEDVASRRTAVVDPAWDVDTIIKTANELDLKITDILLTHSHNDHINGIEGVLNNASAEVHILKPEYEFWAHELDKPTLHHGGDEISLGDSTIKILHTPGHTPGGICLYNAAHDKCLTGDTLFVGSVGRIDGPKASAAQLLDSIRTKLLVLPDKTAIFPGHNYGLTSSSTIGYERRENPFINGLWRLDEF